MDQRMTLLEEAMLALKHHDNPTITMENKYLSNLAHLDLMNFCKAHSIDPSDTRLYKYPRRQVYALVRNADGRAIVTTTLHPNAVPTHFIHPN